MAKRAYRPKPPAHPPGDQPVPPVSYPKAAKAPRSRRVSEPATYNLYEAKTQLSDLVERAAAGETIVIAKAGVPMAHLAPLPAAEKPPLRQPGRLKGKIWIADDFDDPLPPEIQMYFDDPPIWPEESEAMHRRALEIIAEREQREAHERRGGTG